MKNRVDETIEVAVVAYAISEPANGQVRASNELHKRGVFVSPSGVRSIWIRNQLRCFKDRLRALEEEMAKENLILTEVQVQALEKKKQEDGGCAGRASRQSGIESGRRPGVPAARVWGRSSKI